MIINFKSFSKHIPLIGKVELIYRSNHLNLRLANKNNQARKFQKRKEKKYKHNNSSQQPQTFEKILNEKIRNLNLKD